MAWVNANRPGPVSTSTPGADGFIEAVDHRVGRAGVGHPTQHPYRDLEPTHRTDGQGLVGGR